MIEEKEKSPNVEDIISSLKALRDDLSANEAEAIKVIAQRWFSVDESINETKRVELLHSAYVQALDEAVKMLSTFLEHSEHSGLL